VRLCRSLLPALALAGCAFPATPARDASPAPAVDAPPLIADAAPPPPDAAPSFDAARPDSARPAPDAAPAVRACRPFANVDQPIQKLSETGCINPRQPLQPGAGALFYDVASPLWSDAASKERWVFLPPGAKVKLKDCRREPSACLDPELRTGGTYWDEGHFEFPEGTVLMKTFSIDERRVETRLITRHADGWGAYSYQWNDQQTDAVVIALEDGAVAKEVPSRAVNPTNDPKITRAPAGKQLWTFPSRTDCIKCHIDEAGFQLGLDLMQLNTVLVYPDGTRMNQLDVWQARGLFETPPARPYPPALPLPSGLVGSLEQRARSYLHANCAICHRPGSNFPSVDLRWTTPFAGTHTCNAEPLKGTAGVAGAKLVVPGQPGQSLLSLRMHTLEERFRMPQIASAVVDVQGAKLVDDWIASLPPTCPPR
jgi:uncharacterized repeat protein (TIGR03806 family)